METYQRRAGVFMSVCVCVCVYKTERKSVTDGWSKSGWRQRRRVMAGIHLASIEAL